MKLHMDNRATISLCHLSDAQGSKAAKGRAEGPPHLVLDTKAAILLCFHLHSCLPRLEWPSYEKPLDRDPVRHPCPDRLDAAGAGTRGTYCRTPSPPGSGKQICPRFRILRGPGTVNLDAPPWS